MKNFKVYNASAGSGKTTILALEYLVITLQNPSKFRRILAVTFTNKAAAEMKQRIIHYLKDLSLWNLQGNTALKNKLDYIKEQTGLDEEKIQDRATLALKNILHHYSDFAVKTIDSFVHRIIRTFAYDLQLPMDFEVELDADKLLTQSIDLLINKAGVDDNLTNALVAFTEERTDDEKSWNVEYELFQFSKLLLDEEGHLNTRSLSKLSVNDFQKIRKSVLRFKNFFENEIKTMSSGIYKKIVASGINPKSFYQGNKGIYKYFEYLANERYDKLIPNSYVVKTIEDDKWYSSKAPAADKAIIEPLKPEIEDAYRNIEAFLEKYYSRYVVLELIYRKLFPLAVLNETDKILTEIKSLNNLVHISDFNKKVAEIVLSEPIPFIYERVGERYENFFIDEFQDTSEMQWQNMLPLIDNSLASNNLNLVVGDGKQAIYRWRNGNVEQFINLPKIKGEDENIIIKERALTLERNYLPQDLNVNYRSGENIVEFNNKFFQFASKYLDEAYNIIYSGLNQAAHDKDNKGFVNIQFCDEETSKNREEYRDFTLEITANTIESLQSEGYQLKEIGILCRANREANETAEYLLNKKINVVSSESLLLSKSGKVNFMISLLRLINDPSNDIAFVAALRYLDENVLHKDFHQSIQEFLQGNDDSNQDYLQSVLEMMPVKNTDESRVITQLPVYELCEYIVYHYQLNIDNDPYVSFFLEAAWNFNVKSTGGVQYFLEWWDENQGKQYITVPEGLNAVNILTIHKAKGLQFPVVIFPFADMRLESTKETLWINTDMPELLGMEKAIVNTNNLLEKTSYAGLYTDEQQKSLLDLINMLYVAFTRPENELYITCKFPKKGNSFNTPFLIWEFLKSKNLWSEEQLNYTIGERTFSKTKSKFDEEKLKDKKLFYEQIYSSEWSNKLKIKKQASFPNMAEEQLDKIDRGSMMHQILSMIKTPADIQNAVEKAHSQGWFPAGEKKHLEDELGELLSREDIKVLFDGKYKILMERDILDGNGRIFRPDRVIIDGKNVKIVEYKTGIKDPAHKNQVKRYGELFQEMDYHVEELLLLYLDTKELMRV